MGACNPTDAACTIRIAARGITSVHNSPAVSKDEGGQQKLGGAVVLSQERVGKSGKLAAPSGGKDPLGPHMSGANLSMAVPLLDGTSNCTSVHNNNQPSSCMVSHNQLSWLSMRGQAHPSSSSLSPSFTHMINAIQTCS